MNFLHVGLTDNHLLTSNNDLLINKADKDEKNQLKIIPTQIKIIIIKIQKIKQLKIMKYDP